MDNLISKALKWVVFYIYVCFSKQLFTSKAN